ncbi:8-oxo-dGTP pyrophosphatase MutT, NUDIX family [Roseovarius azorensis]|uniref:8-oxo-dGTP pyrophosphatase MutT, NUDIX family n=1 Tax=Roseovarius azorensis TaxID=1287727 RepID=A0A1H7KER7_9RHOB|nr:CoA pyrophosphatase [Roseovarius azorensis]SEK85010.1 8-oxo-dGTP pyrophosphatase MutT, NUDIX family [Roseovarius azorensis]
MATDPLDRILAALGDARTGSSDYDLNPGVILPPGRKLRAAGVLVPVLCGHGPARVILTKRSSALKHHPGQIAFPGGKQDAQDPDITATALREASEEIGLDPGNVEVLGYLPKHETVTGFDVTPVMARVHAPFQPRAQAGEVDEVFDVPLAHLLDPGRFRVEKRLWRGNWRHYYTVPFGPYYIWGATARILRSMADLAGPR